MRVCEASGLGRVAHFAVGIKADRGELAAVAAAGVYGHGECVSGRAGVVGVGAAHDAAEAFDRALDGAAAPAQGVASGG